MTLMILGLALWWASHLYPIYLPGHRAATLKRLGEKLYKSFFAMVALIAVVLMVSGFRKAGFVEVWTPPGWATHLNNLLMLLAVFLIGAKDAKSSAKHYVRHPMLAAVKVWAVAHLLVNGDVASVILFGGMLGWAVVPLAGRSQAPSRRSDPACSYHHCGFRCDRRDPRTAFGCLPVSAITIPGRSA